MEKLIIADNEKSIFYKDRWTEQLKEYADGLNLDCYIAETRDGKNREYILIDENQNPVYVSSNFEGVCYRIDALRKLNE